MKDFRKSFTRAFFVLFDSLFEEKEKRRRSGEQQRAAESGRERQSDRERETERERERESVLLA